MGATIRPLLAFLFVTLTNFAHAQTAAQTNINQAGDLMTPPAGDLSISVLTQILGGDPLSPNGQALVVFGAAMSIFNMIMMAVAAVIFTYTAVAGVIYTGHDGSLLGKKWNASMIPLRYAAAAILLAPTASGLSMGQMMTIWGVELGIGTADSVWKAAASDFLANQAKLVGLQANNNSEIKQLMTDVLKADTCVALHNNELNVQAGTQGVAYFGSSMNGSRLQWGAVSQDALTRGFSASECGSITGSHMLTTGEGGAAASAAAMGPWALGKLISSVGAALSGAEADMMVKKMQAIQGVEAQYLAPMANRMTPVRISKPVPGTGSGDASTNPLDSAVDSNASHVIVMNDPSFVMPAVGDIQAAIDGAAVQYATQVTQALQSKASGDPNMKQMQDAVTQDAQQNGWINAGVWFFQFAKIQSEYARMANRLPEDNIQTPDNPAILPAESKKRIDKAIASAVTGVQEFGTTGAPSSLLSSIFKYVGGNGDFTMSLFGYDPNDYRHPLLQIQSSGEHLVGICGTLFALLSVATAAGDAVGSVASLFPGAGTAISGVTKMLTSLGTMATTLVLALLAVGITKLYVIPMLPFFKWLKQVILFFITTAEVLVATPLWIAFHMHPDGDGLSSDQAKAGYGLMLEAALRPVLLVFAMLTAYMLMIPLMGFAHNAFLMAFNSQLTEVSGLLGVLSLAAQAVMYCVMCIVVTVKCLDVIDTLPGTVLRWVNIHAGGSSGDLDDRVDRAMHTFSSEGRQAAAGGFDALSKANAATAPAAPVTPHP